MSIPAPKPAHPAYLHNIRHWSNSVTPPPTNGRTQPSRSSHRERPARSSRPLAITGAPLAITGAPVPTPAPPHPSTSAQPPPPHDALRPATQAHHTTYAARLRTGATLLVQPILASQTPAAGLATRASRRGGVVNYADPGSADELPDAGALDSDDSDFVASGGTRTAVRAARISSRAPAGAGVFHAGGGATPRPATPAQQHPQKHELDHSYLGQVPPARFITAKPAAMTRHEYFTQDVLDAHAQRPPALVPIRVEFETDALRVRDCFVWNLHERLTTPEAFARVFCADLDLPPVPYAELVAAQIRTQLEEHDGVARAGPDAPPDESAPGDELAECRVVLQIDVQLATFHLLDHIEWDLLSPLTPEEFARQLAAELGLGGEAPPLIAHAVHEELVKHRRDALEWGVLGGAAPDDDDDRPRDRSGAGLLKDKTGLGLSWGRAPKDGRGPKPLRSVWRDWAEAEEFRTRFEVLSAEEVERREVERERASRRLRRETSKFQSQGAARRRR